MKQFLTIFLFELSSYKKNKAFIGITIFLSVAIILFLSFPNILALFDDGKNAPEPDFGSGFNTSVDGSEGDGSDNNSNEDMNFDDTFLLVNNSDMDMQTMGAMLEQLLFSKMDLQDISVDEATELVKNGDYEYAIVLDSLTKYTYIQADSTMYDNTQYDIDEFMKNAYKSSLLAELNIPEETIQNILAPQIEGEIIITGKNQMDTFFYTYILIFGLYMAILLYGSLVATSVATEKSSRAMEMLITSAKPTNLIFGKILGSACAGIIQLGALLGSAFVGYNINKVHWKDNFIVNSIFSMPLSIMLYTILFFVLGFLIYAFLYGAVGSLVSKVEELNTSSMPITFTFMIAFFIIMTGMASGNVDTLIIKIASFVPFTSPMAMFVRIAMGNVSAIEIILSVLILVVSTVLVGILSAKIYRLGVLMYGKPPKFLDVVKNVVRKDV